MQKLNLFLACAYQYSSYPDNIIESVYNAQIIIRNSIITVITIIVIIIIKTINIVIVL